MVILESDIVKYIFLNVFLVKINNFCRKTWIEFVSTFGRALFSHLLITFSRQRSISILYSSVQIHLSSIYLQHSIQH